MIMTLNSFSALNLPSVSFTSSDIVFGRIMNPTKIQVPNATIGIRTLLLTKSMISSTDMPIQLMKLSGPKPSEDGAPKISARTATKRHAFLRPQWNLSRKMDTMVSIREIADVKAAKNTSRKKIVPIAPPNFMLANTFGSVMNISPGPAPSAERSPPENANTAGMIIRPARKAMPVSNISIWRTELSRLLSFFI